MSRRNEEEDYVPKAFRKNKKAVEQTQEPKKRGVGKKKETKKSAKKRKIKKVILSILVIIILITGISLGILANRWKTLAKEMIANQNSIVVDTDQKEIAKLGCERKNEPISSIPDNLKNAYVAIEDERFYSHGGIDLKRTGGAIFSYITHFGKSSYGGSTITQQLVKNLTGDSTDSITRKVKEWWKAWQLETCLSKDEILSSYLNIIYVGPNMYGVEVGAKYYFNKSAKDLKLEECAFLAGINHSPNSYNPFEGKDNKEKIAKRAKTVLGKMLELKYISEEDYNLAVSYIDKGLPFKKGEVKAEEAVYSYHTDALILEITEDIAKKYNISKTFATNYINMAGLTIHSTQDSSVQEKTETEFEKSKYSLPSNIGNDPSQAAMVIIDHKTGYVVGCTGGLGKKTKARSLNRATQSVRQTGSAIKPLSVLIPGIDKKIITASTIYDDTERDFENGTYHPTDYNPPLGKVTVRRALESSQNVPFVEIMEKIQPQTAMKYLEKMGVTTLTEKDKKLVLALGGLEKGISPLEMAGAYAMIANDGEYIEPTFYSTIDNNSGKNILKTKQEKKRVVSKEVAYIVKEMLTQPVNGAHGTATYCKISGVDVAAKTGTTDDNYDRWLCGFTPYYTAVAWYGYDTNESIYYNKRNPAGLLWANVMSRVHTGVNSAKFEKPSGVSSCTICAETGKKATTGCPNTYTEYFLWLTAPGLCDKHSGSELKENNNSTTTNKVEEIVKGITQDIDAEDPQEVLPNNRNNNATTNQTSNSTNSTKTNTTVTTNRTNTTNNSNQTNQTNTNSFNSNNTGANSNVMQNNTVNRTNTSGSSNTTTATNTQNTTTNTEN